MQYRVGEKRLERVKRSIPLQHKNIVYQIQELINAA
jgi:hypothetical protein